ncbi:putative HTH domain antitoxin [Paenibacillus shirakamiensis]|uniref:HTH domain antitoxin n=1 Tax=Paenibacillus shirakamiensis TaxID=1265935 RepID=A0ABS4JMB7_9BACL|nr:ATP-binding protein [Paenibacillus shirakamiensis]MBP2002261.1 putative HTH domain antitoxin [Paenibacillus shirakamiensis]
MIYLQIIVDSIIMMFLCYALAGHAIRLNKPTVTWFLWFSILNLWLRMLGTSSPDPFAGLEMNNFDLLPADNPFILIVLILCLFMLNSEYIRPLSNIKVIVVTMLSFLIWILIRTFSISAVAMVLSMNHIAYPYVHQVFTIVLATLLYYFLIIRNGHRFLADLSGLFTKIIIIQSSIAVLIILGYSNFSTSFVLENLLFIVIAFSFVISMNIWIIFEHRTRARQETKFAAMEQYLPVIDELVSEVQARQHEFHNKLLAIHSIVETSVSLPEARSLISTYTKDVMMQIEIREILQMDNKVIGGFLYTKMKLAKFKKIKLTTHIHAGFIPMITDEHQVLEILGILLDSAIESSFPQDEIVLTVQRSDEHLWTEMTVMNPHAHCSTNEFMQMFATGYTTKRDSNETRGYGLYNVKQIVVQHQGKIITRNTMFRGIPYISIGVLIP